ncbi:hypothetical protein Pvag_1403 [Pantoea vagans C9-1]|nr:hypothetical protein Pvag_1403 [Pantoea vagans C9-1]
MTFSLLPVCASGWQPITDIGEFCGKNVNLL